MRLLLDQGLPRTAAAFLREAGVDTVHTGEIGFATAEDAVILDRAQAERCIVVTLDADFHALLALTNASSPSVIRIRIEGLRSGDLVKLVQILLDDWGEELERGVMLTVQPGRVRIRHLPIGG